MLPLKIINRVLLRVWKKTNVLSSYFVKNATFFLILRNFQKFVFIFQGCLYILMFFFRVWKTEKILTNFWNISVIFKGLLVNVKSRWAFFVKVTVLYNKYKGCSSIKVRRFECRNVKKNVFWNSKFSPVYPTLTPANLFYYLKETLVMLHYWSNKNKICNPLFHHNFV